MTLLLLFAPSGYMTPAMVDPETREPIRIEGAQNDEEEVELLMLWWMLNQ